MHRREGNGGGGWGVGGARETEMGARMIHHTRPITVIYCFSSSLIFPKRPVIYKHAPSGAQVRKRGGRPGRAWAVHAADRDLIGSRSREIEGDPEGYPAGRPTLIPHTSLAVNGGAGETRGYARLRAL